MKKEAVVKSPGGILVRLLQGLKVFKIKIESWPTTLIIGKPTLETLRDHHLTELGFNFLKIKLKIVISEDENEIMFENSLGEKAGYTSDAWEFTEPIVSADEWLFGVKIYDDN